MTKKYKIAIFYVFFSILLATFMYFYYSERIIIIWHDDISNKNINDYSQLLHYKGIWINTQNNQNEIIPIHISSQSINNNINSNELLNIFLQSYFNHINVEYNEKYSFQFEHAILYNNTVIIQGNLEIKKKLEILDEYNLLKSIFLSIQSTIPQLKTIILYQNDKLLDLEYFIPFFSYQMLIEYDKMNLINIPSTFNNNDHAQSSFIAYFETPLGNQIDNYYEKAIYQTAKYKNKFSIIDKIVFTKNNNFINHNNKNNPDQIIYYTSFTQTKKSDIHIFYYPFLESRNSNIIQSVHPIPELKIKNKDLEQIKYIKTKLPNSSFHIAPLKIFFNTIYQQLFIVCQIKSFDEMEIILDNIIKL